MLNILDAEQTLDLLQRIGYSATQIKNTFLDLSKLQKVVVGRTTLTMAPSVPGYGARFLAETK